MYRDILLVTADSVRLDAVGSMPHVSSLSPATGVTVASYTRPSLAALLSSSYRAAVQTTPVAPTLPEILSDAGYTCLGFSPNPNTHEKFGFDRGFDVYDTYVDPGSRGSSLRQYLAQFDTLLRIYYRLYPPQAKNEHRPTDEEVIRDAVDAFNAADPPRFLWVHLMESHRPYGRGDDGIPSTLDRRAVMSPEKLTQEQHDEIRDKYRAALGRVDNNIERLRDELHGDPIFVFSSDHGEAFGEDGYYFHPGQRRSVHDTLIDVPVVFDGMSIERERLSLVDIAPTILAGVEIDPPSQWDGYDLTTAERTSAITIAPWHDKATVCWQDFEQKLIARDAAVEIGSEGDRQAVERIDVSEEMTEQLRDLGYLDAG